MRIASGILAVVFVLSAVVQWNDPDPLLWMAGYLVAAMLSGAAAMGRVPFLPNAVAAGLFTLGFLWLAPTLFGAEQEAFTSFRMRAESHEEPREAVGLAIAAGWCATLAIRGWRARES